MSGAEKAFELQRQVRRNATEYTNSVKDLYAWEREIKQKEKDLKNAPAAAANTKLPVRSQVEKSATKGSPSSSAPSTPTEKQDLPLDPAAQQHKKANDIKDRGNSYVKQAEYDRAIEAYSQAISIYPDDPIYYINRALCHLKKESHELCVEDCEAAIALDRLCVKAYYRRMQANESLGNNMEALKDCTTVLAIEPKNMEAKVSLARINERLRKHAIKSGPNFIPERDDMLDIQPFDKPVYRRSKQPMRRVPIVDVVTPRATGDDTKNLRISDDDIDKIFNSYCGVFEEVKNPGTPAKSSTKVGPILETIEEAKAEQKPSPPKTAASVEAVKAPSPSAALPKQTESPRLKERVESAKPASEIQAVAKEMEDKPAERALPPAPTGTAQFHVTWKELSATQKYQYLKSIETPNLCKLLGAGFDSETFTDLLRTLEQYYVPNKEDTTAAVLLEMSKNDEFTILAMLMSAEEKKMVATILSAIKNWPNNNTALLQRLSDTYGVA